VDKAEWLACDDPRKMLEFLRDREGWGAGAARVVSAVGLRFEGPGFFLVPAVLPAGQAAEAGPPQARDVAGAEKCGPCQVVPGHALVRPAARAAGRAGAPFVAWSNLSGSKLLQDRDRLGTAAFIVNHLNKVMDARGSRESKKRELEKFAYYWVLPRSRPILAKMPGEDYLRPIPINVSKVAGP
jgi:hypothetical protein